jgi:hypothetical protein
MITIAAGYPGRGADPDQHAGYGGYRDVVRDTADDPAVEHEKDAGKQHPTRTELLGDLAGSGLRYRAGQIQGRYQDRRLSHWHVQRVRDRHQCGRNQ